MLFRSKRLLISRKVDGCRYEFNGNDSINQIQDPRLDYTSQKSIATIFRGFPKTSIYYKFLNLFVSSNTAFSVMMMRILNSLIFCVFFVIVLVLSEKKIKQSVLLALYLTSLPSGFFLISGINSSSWGYIGCFFSWVFLLNTLSTKGQPISWLVTNFTCWFVAVWLVISSRKEALLFLLISNIFVVFAKKDWGQRTKAVLLISTAALTLMLRNEVIKTDYGNNALFNLVKVLNPDDISNEVLNILNGIKLALALPIRNLGYEPLGWLGTQTPNEAVFAGILLVLIFIFQICRKPFYFERKIAFKLVGIYVSLTILATLTFPNWSSPFYFIRTGWRNDAFRSRYLDRKSTRLNSSHVSESRMPSSA